MIFKGSSVVRQYQCRRRQTPGTRPCEHPECINCWISRLINYSPPTGADYCPSGGPLRAVWSPETFLGSQAACCLCVPLEFWASLRLVTVREQCDAKNWIPTNQVGLQGGMIIGTDLGRYPPRPSPTQLPFAAPRWHRSIGKYVQYLKVSYLYQ